MPRGMKIGLALVLFCMPAAGIAQTPTPQAYVYVTYFVCDPAGESRADEIIERNFKPHYDAAAEAGNIIGWSWLTHYVGGPWRRALVITAPNMDDLLDTAGALGEIIEATTPEAGRAFTEVCDQHVDYIWQTIEGVGATASEDGSRGSAGFSTYFDCNTADEREADELVRRHFAPIYNARIANGELRSWGWLQHNVGGEWRRLLTVSGDDHKSLARTRAALIEQMQSGRTERALRQFSQICSSHQDYMWDIRLETP